MFDIDSFLVDFENLIFEEHLEKIQSFKRKYGNAVSCCCPHINKEKEYIAKIMNNYYKLSQRFKNKINSNCIYNNYEHEISSNSFDTVG